MSEGFLRLRRPTTSPAWNRRSAFEAQADSIAERVVGGQSAQWPGGAAQGSKDALPPQLAQRLESRTGYDFSGVRVHADLGSRRTARRLGAAAYTVGSDIFLGDDTGRDAGYLERTLAHEAIHAAQQGALSRRQAVWGGPAVGRSASGVPQLTPGTDADDSWRELVRERFIPDESPLRGRGTQAKDRFLRAGEGKRLTNSLWHLSRDRARNPRFRVDVAFRTDLPPQARGLDASGFFEPDSADAGQYTVSVKDVPPPTYSGSITLGGMSGEGVYSTHTDPESDMATTLHHELEHVEFVRTGAGTVWPTGHGDVTRGQVEPAFRQRIEAFAHDIDAIENRIHENAAAERQRAATPTPQPTPDVRPTPARPTPTGPPFAGLRISADAGVAGQAGVRFGGVAGADLVLGRISSLNIGVRGVYLTPDRLFAGGTVGFRAVQTGDARLGERVDNPLFFDLEAGVVGQLNSAESARIMDRVAVFGSGGIGQEYGTSGSRFFWRIGGYVIVSDRKEVAGGGTVGVGVRFQ